MNYHTKTRIPVNDEYAATIGKAVYVFAYYEWIIIYIVEGLKPGFVQTYSRGNPQSSNKQLKNFQSQYPQLQEMNWRNVIIGFCN